MLRSKAILVVLYVMFSPGLAGWSSRCQAGPASPHVIIEQQPDGTRIAIHVRGDEWFHWQEDLNGYTVVQRPDRVYVYAALDETKRLAPGDLIVGKADPAAAGLAKRILPPADELAKIRARGLGLPPGAEPDEFDANNRSKLRGRAQPKGQVKNLVVLMRFANHASRTLPPPADFDTIFNKPGGDPVLAPTGSVRDVYLENSYGGLQLNSTVFQWVTLPKSEKYYADSQAGLSSKIHEAIRGALALLDPQVDFKQFDQDRDGWADAIAFVHSGYGAEWGGTDQDGAAGADRIWSHRWSIPAWTSAEGIKVSPYHINPGLWGLSGASPGRIGVICHETGHFFGLPDLYDGGLGEGLGSWCLMANSWGFDGSQLHPPHFSAWCKARLGWVTPAEVTAAADYSLPAAEKSPAVLKIASGYAGGEYLLIENRQPLGYDQGIPGGTSGRGGLAIYHVDERKGSNTDPGYPGQSGWPGNNKHYMIALLQADGKYELENGIDRGDGDDLYRNGFVTALNSTTVPNLNGYQNGQVVVPSHAISQISESGSTMNFRYSAGAEEPSAEAEWTVMVFVNGDNNLESFALDDFAEMAQVGSTGKVNIVVQFDRSPSYSTALEDWKHTLRFLVKAGMKPTPANAVEDLGEVNMGDGQVLADFVTWARAKYPAKRYMLDIWDHGQGWRVSNALRLQDPPGVAAAPNREAQLRFRNGLRDTAKEEARASDDWRVSGIGVDQVVPGPVRYVSSDDTSDDHLFNREIQDALLEALEGDKLDVIGFDACLMAMIETGYALREVAGVMVASQDLEPGPGWDYQRALSKLVGNPVMDAEELGKALVVAYEEEYGSAGGDPDPTTTLSAVRLEPMRKLAAATSRLGDACRARLAAEGAKIRQARDACANFAPGYGLHGIDLDRFCEQVGKLSASGTVRSRADAVRSALKGVVIRNYAGAARQGAYGSKGLAVYFPLTKTQYDYDPDGEGYRDSNTNYPVQFVQDHRWDNFLHAYFVVNP